jgi:hypothetical protein
MNSIFKLLDQPSVKEAWNDVMEALVVERLKENYVMCLDFNDIETATALLTVLRYFTVYEDFIEFINEVKDAGYNITREY